MSFLLKLKRFGRTIPALALRPRISGKHFNVVPKIRGKLNSGQDHVFPFIFVFSKCINMQILGCPTVTELMGV